MTPGVVTREVVDADGHVLEPLDRFPELHVERDSIGLDHVYAGAQEIVTVSLDKFATPGSNMADLSRSPTYDQAQRGGFDPHLRLADTDAEGIGAAVLYPSVGLNFWAVTDADVADYTHHDATVPGAVNKIRATIAPLSATDQQRVLAGNALDCYRLEP